MDKEMVVEQENREAKVENGTVAEPSTIDNEDQPMAEIDTQDDSQADNGGSVPDDLANVDTSPPADHFIDEIYDRNTGRRIDRSTMSFDRIPDMYVRVSQPITHPAAFELICTRIFLEAWQGDSRLIRYEDFSFDHEILPGVEPYCATPDCDCDQ